MIKKSGMLAAALVLAGLAAAGAASAGTLERIRQDGTVRIAYRDDAPPFSLKGEGGVPGGYSVELCRAVGEDLKRQLQLPRLEVNSPATLMELETILIHAKARAAEAWHQVLAARVAVLRGRLETPTTAGADATAGPGAS